MLNTPELQLADFIESHPKLWVLTGAGISRPSGIPTYRDEQGQWQRNDPITHQEFLSQPFKRQRYWARSLIGWPHVKQAQPNAAHQALAMLEAEGRIQQLVTQNVDGLHQRAGSEAVIDLHGRIDQVVCLDCGAGEHRADLQVRLEEMNPWLTSQMAQALPDGDADLEDDSIAALEIPSCKVCGGTLKPDVVFFGANVPKETVNEALDQLKASDGMLVIGSSLQVYSGFRFCRAAAEWGIPMASINPGSTRADDLLNLRLTSPCEELLPRVVGF